MRKKQCHQVQINGEAVGVNCRRGGNGEEGSSPVEDDTVFEQFDRFTVIQGNIGASIFLYFAR